MQQRYATVAVVLALFAVASSAQIVPAQLRMTAWAVNMTGGSSDTMEIRVNEWSAPIRTWSQRSRTRCSCKATALE